MVIRPTKNNKGTSPISDQTRADIGLAKMRMELALQNSTARGETTAPPPRQDGVKTLNLFYDGMIKYDSSILRGDQGGDPKGYDYANFNDIPKVIRDNARRARPETGTPDIKSGYTIINTFESMQGALEIIVACSCETECNPLSYAYPRYLDIGAGAALARQLNTPYLASYSGNGEAGEAFKLQWFKEVCCGECVLGEPTALDSEVNVIDIARSTVYILQGRWLDDTSFNKHENISELNHMLKQNSEFGLGELDELKKKVAELDKVTCDNCS